MKNTPNPLSVPADGLKVGVPLNRAIARTIAAVGGRYLSTNNGSVQAKGCKGGVI
jgi:hypothetical protein